MIDNKVILNIIVDKKIIATIALIDNQLSWHYKPFWQEIGYAISPYLPLYEKIPSSNIQAFLNNLLPEGNALDQVTTYFHLSKNNTFGLVKALGLDMPGSLIILPSTQTLPEKELFRPIPNEELKQRLDNRDHVNLIIWDDKPRLSVAGVQDKINVILNEKKELGFGEQALCSTHILKFEKQNFFQLVFNEYITMQLAKHCGLNIANVELMNYGGHPALLVKRFDRQFISMSQIKRQHIIDGCQALNLPPEYKYERNFGNGRDVAHIREGASYIKLFNFAGHCTNPALTKQKILDWALFNILICNYDAHGKNISFFIGYNGISLTPFYDLVNIKVYSELNHEMAMAFGDEFDSNEIHAYQLADFADSCHLARHLVSKRLKYLIKKLKIALNENFFSSNNAEQNIFLKNYATIINERCQHFSSQADEITSITL